MSAASLSATVRYIVPGPSSVASTFTVSLDYTASSVGFVDVAEGTADATAFDVPLGTVDDVKAVFIQNNTAQQLNVRINGAVADEYSLPPGGVFVPLFAATAALDEPVTQLELVTTASVTADGTIGFVVLGDDATP